MTDEELDEWAVLRLASEVRQRLKEARRDGRSGWYTVKCTNESLSEALHANVKSGDPVDVAVYCAFLIARCNSILPTNNTKLELALTKWGQDIEKFVSHANQLNDTLSKSHGVVINTIAN